MSAMDCTEEVQCDVSGICSECCVVYVVSGVVCCAYSEWCVMNVITGM